MLMMPQAASVLGCERLWLNISATLIFLRFHAGSRLTIGVASWTWNSSAVALDLKRKLVTKSCIASFLDTNLCVQKRGDTRFHRRSNSQCLPALSDPAARSCHVWGGFFPAAAAAAAAAAAVVEIVVGVVRVKVALGHVLVLVPVQVVVVVAAAVASAVLVE